MRCQPLHNPELATVLFGNFTARLHGMAPCPRCKGKDLWPEVCLDADYGIYCATCDWVGPRVASADDDPDQAVAAWNDECRKIALARDMGLTVNMTQPRENPDE